MLYWVRIFSGCSRNRSAYSGMINSRTPSFGGEGVAKDEIDYGARTAYTDKERVCRYDFVRFEKDKKKRRRDMEVQRAIVRALGRLEDCKTVFDMPCGTGRLVKTLTQAGYFYFGCDISKEMLDMCLQKFYDSLAPHLLKGDGEDLPFRDDTFDCIVCIRFMHLLPSEPRLRFLKEFHRVSKKYLLIETGAFRKPTPIIDKCYSRFSALMPNVAERRERQALRHAKRRALDKDLADAGWLEHVWVPYKRSGYFSTTKLIGIFKKM